MFINPNQVSCFKFHGGVILPSSRAPPLLFHNGNQWTCNYQKYCYCSEMLVNTIKGVPDPTLMRNACGIPKFHCKILTVIGIKCLVACSWSRYIVMSSFLLIKHASNNCVHVRVLNCNVHALDYVILILYILLWLFHLICTVAMATSCSDVLHFPFSACHWKSTLCLELNLFVWWCRGNLINDPLEPDQTVMMSDRAD